MAERPSDGTPLWPGPEDLAARLGRLERQLDDLEGLRSAVESALVAQASRIESVLATARRELVDRVAAEADGARQAAEEVREALAQARDLTADRLDAAAGATTDVADVVRAALARLEATADDQLAQAAAGARAATGPVEALAGAVDGLHALVVEARDEAAEDRARVDRLADQVAALATTVDTALAGVTDALGRQATDTAAAVRSAADAAAGDLHGRLDAAAGPLRDATTAIQALDRSLRQHVDEMEWRANAERARLTQSFVEQLADGLGRRERRRLAKRFELPERPDASTPEPESPPAVPATVVDPPEPEASLVVDDVPTWEKPAAEAAAARPVATDEEGPDGDAPRRVTPSRRTRPVRRTASDPQDPAAVRRALAAVRGLGPARQSALIDRFGTLEAIREASDEDLLAIPGIGPALLPGIREVVG